MQVLDQQIELIVTASVGLVWSGQHLAHNAQRQNAPAYSTHYFAITIEENVSPKEQEQMAGKDAVIN